MSQMTEPATREIANRYMAVWSQPDPGARRAAVEGLWAPNGVEFLDGGTQFRGYEELDARVARAYDEFVGSGRYAITAADDVTRHGDIITLTAQLTRPDGGTDWEARVFLLVGDDGRIQEDYHLTVKPLPA